jgi:hypothetical protein
MNKYKNNKASKPLTEIGRKNTLMREAHAELDEYNETKKTVTDLLNYKKSLIDIEDTDFDKINEIKGKAIDAINHLFNDIINTNKKQ